MTKLRHILVLLLLCAMTVGAQQLIVTPTKPERQPVKKSAEQVYAERARREEQRGNYEAALTNWNEILKTAPRDPSALSSIPNCLIQLRRFDEAEQFLNTQIERAKLYEMTTVWQDPASVFNLTLRLGEVKLARDEKDKAWEIWRAALAMQPNNPDAARTFVSVLQRNRRWEDSEEFIRDYRKETKNSGFMALELASSLQAQMNYVGATEELLAYTKSSPTAWQIAQTYLSRFPEDTTVEANVLGVLEQAIKRDRKDPAVWRMYAGYTMKSGRLEKSLDATIAADSLSQSGGATVLTTAQQLLAENEIELARRGFEKVSAWKGPEQLVERAELGLAQCLEAQGKFTEAKASYERFIAGRTKSAELEEARFHIAEILLTHEQNPAAALVEFTGIFQRSKAPLKTRAGMRMGDAHAYMGEYGAAIDAWSLAGGARGDFTDETGALMMRIARANIWRDSTALASAALDSITRGSTQNMTFNDAILYSALLEGGGFHGALRAFADADYATFRGDHATAATKFGEAASLLNYGRLAEWCRMSEAEALRESGKPTEAISALDKFVESFPESADLPRAKYLQAVITLEDLKQDDQALKMLEEYLVEYPRSLYLEQARRKARVLANKVS